MAGEQTPTSEYQTPQWVLDLSEADKADYERARSENIEEILPGVRYILQECIPGLQQERPEEFEAAARRWATSCRNNYEVGIQIAKDAWGRPHPEDVRFRMNVIGN